MHSAVVSLGHDTSEETIAAFIDSIKQDPHRRDELVELLPEQIPLYAGRGANATIRIRAYVLAAFQDVGLPARAVPYVLDELQNGRSAYLTAAAARAARGLEDVGPDVVPYLLRAIENIRLVDDTFSFDSYHHHLPTDHSTSALREIFETFRWLGARARSALDQLEALLHEDAPRMSADARAALAQAIESIRGADIGAEVEADCCCADPIAVFAERAPQPDSTRAAPVTVELEDQDGRRLSYGDFFSQTPSIVVFFYTRCDNPNKCSLSITNLGRLQQAIAATGLSSRLRTAAITYDGGYDLPARLRAYGENRGVVFDEHNRFFRARTGFDTLREYFQLGVNFGPALVNRHRIELFVLDDRGSIVDSFTRLQWDPQEVLERAAALLSPIPTAI